MCASVGSTWCSVLRGSGPGLTPRPLPQAWWRGVRQRRQYLVQRAERIKARVEQLRREVDELKDRRLWEEQTLNNYRPHVSQRETH